VKRLIKRNHLDDNIDRRGFLQCMSWAGTGVIWTPGTAPAPGPMKVPDDQLRRVLGISDVNFVRRNHSLAVVNSTLADTMVK